MKSATPTLLPLLRSRSQGEVMAAILLHPDREQSLSEVAAVAGTSLATAQREVERLEASGLVTSTRRGNLREIKPVTDSVVYKPLADLLAVTFGPVGILREALGRVDGIESAFIHGSWAARYAQQPGSVPRDIDLLVIGDPDRDQLEDALSEVEPVLQREINARRVSPTSWKDSQDSFKQTVLSRPVVWLIGENDG